ncbi:MAG TPA: 50S ribosomal protein L25 [Nannocystaceae bacterium]|nr:50S ribosomal protein L25 [Nannocystaceae bacterium]
MVDSSAFGILEVSPRTAGGKGAVRQLRRAGKFPAVVYGRGGENRTIAIDPLAFGKASDPAKGYNTYFQLSVVEGGKTVAKESCVITDIQRDALRGDVVHIDFMRVDPEKEVVRQVPVRITGRAAGVITGGRIKTFRRTVHVAAKPALMPTEVVVDVTPLEMNQSLRVRDIKLEHARIDESPDAPLAHCELARTKVEGDEGGAPGAGGAPAKPAAGAAPAKPAAGAAPAKPAGKK